MAFDNTEIVTIRVTKEVKEYIQVKAETDSRSFANMAQVVLSEYVAEKKAESK